MSITKADIENSQYEDVDYDKLTKTIKEVKLFILDFGQNGFGSVDKYVAKYGNIPPDFFYIVQRDPQNIRLHAKTLAETITKILSLDAQNYKSVVDNLGAQYRAAYE